MADEAAAGYLAGRIDALREHIASLAAAVPQLPAEIGRVRQQLELEWQTRPPGTVLGLIAAFVLIGLALEGAYRYLVHKASVQDASARDRVRSIGLILARDLGAVAVFTVGSAVAFLALDWPARTREAVIAFLASLILLRITIAVSRALLAPLDTRLRILPASDAEAAFWHRRIALFAGWFAFGWVIREWLLLLGMDPASLRVVIYALGLGLLAIATEAFWRRSRVLAIYFALLWVFWAMRAFGLLWLAVVIALLPLVMRLAQGGVDHALRQPGAAASEGRGIAAATLGRALRALAIIGAAFLLVNAFGLDVDALAAGDTVWMRLVRGAVHALVIILVADVLWLVTASLIDQKLAQGESNMRLRTLLPIVRGTVAVVLIVMTVLMALSVLGIEVGPLLASAGVIGIAVGFGAQTLVRDLFSKFFYLLDDAFRVGEYIQSGNYKGTVEHLGARSIRLRHHRGPVYTIPYGQLGAVQNMSRDWVIDKLQIGITYDSDLDKARKLIKKIGQTLAQDPALAPDILETLKMQGVEDFADYAIKIRLKMMTKPGQQFVIRRKAYAMIKQAFDENGIKFAYPTVQIAGPADATTAAAAAAVQQGLELKKAP